MFIYRSHIIIILVTLQDVADENMSIIKKHVLNEII